MNKDTNTLYGVVLILLLLGGTLLTSEVITLRERLNEEQVWRSQLLDLHLISMQNDSILAVHITELYKRTDNDND